MSRRPDPRYRAAWIALHAAGVAACLLVELLLEPTDPVLLLTWWLYFAAVAGLELWTVYRIRLGRTAAGTFSWTVWAFLPGPGPRAELGRLVLIVGWCLFLLLGFTFRGWTPWPAVNAAAAMAFELWLWPHFFHPQRRSAAP